MQTSGDVASMQHQVPSQICSTASALQQQAISSTDAQQQTKYVFNVETDKAAQSLQLLFQLPTIPQQDQQQQQLQQTQSLNQAIAQTQTCHNISSNSSPHQSQIQQQQLPNNIASLQHAQQQILSQAQGQLPHCAQQVQVATQTSQSSGNIVPHLMRNCSSPSFGSCLQPALGSNQLIDINNSIGGSLTPNLLSKPSNNSSVGKKTSDKMSRKEKNRFTASRQAPAGQGLFY